MKLKKLAKEIPFTAVKGNKEIEITGVCSNSKLVAPGNLFIARKGRCDDGLHYVPEAVAAGAVAVVTDIYDPLLDKKITQLIHPDVGAMEALTAAHFYGFPSDELFMVGITGTNGKTTTSFLVKHLLDTLVGPSGLIGTIKYIVGSHHFDATRTTPDAISNQKMLREMASHRCKSAVMEVTSHALDQHRVDCIHFDTAVFTNLTLDHLDYHQTMEHYCDSKAKLFQSLDPSKIKKAHPYPKTAIVNADSAWKDKILSKCKAGVLTYGIEAHADLRAEQISFTPSGTSFTLNFRGERIPIEWPLSGRFNVYNCLAAAAVGLSRKLPLADIAAALRIAPAVPGRLQPVNNPLGLKIYVDFAHSDDALQNVLECLQEFKKGRILVVFGCGGNRDTSKRPKMARVCEEHADLAIVTSDNPRTEDPDVIIRDILKGFRSRENVLVESDRYKAIEKAVDLAGPNDMILIAGKGHEPYQIFAHKTIEFDDAKVALEICNKRTNVRTL